MADDARTIVLLSHKRSGTSALFRVFRDHPSVGVCHVDPTRTLWEPNFWNLAAQGIRGDTEPFRKRFAESHPFLEVPEVFTEEAVFAMWDRILAELGPILFDKSPQYLGNREALALLKAYRVQGNDVRFVGLIRDPRDTIASQYERLGRGSFRKKPRAEFRKAAAVRTRLLADCPEVREKHWLGKNAHLDELLAEGEDIPVFRYEDMTQAPSCYFPMLFKHCGVSNVTASFADFRPVNLGRYWRSSDPVIRKWRWSAELAVVLRRYGYRFPTGGLIDLVPGGVRRLAAPKTWFFIRSLR